MIVFMRLDEETLNDFWAKVFAEAKREGYQTVHRTRDVAAMEYVFTFVR